MKKVHGTENAIKGGMGIHVTTYVHHCDGTEEETWFGKFQTRLTLGSPRRDHGK